MIFENFLFCFELPSSHLVSLTVILHGKVVLVDQFSNSLCQYSGSVDQGTLVKPCHSLMLQSLPAWHFICQAKRFQNMSQDQNPFFANGSIFCASWEYRLVPLLVMSPADVSYSLYLLPLLLTEFHAGSRNLFLYWNQGSDFTWVEIVGRLRELLRLWTTDSSLLWVYGTYNPKWNDLCRNLLFIDWFFFSIHRKKERTMFYGFHFFFV